LRRRLHGDRALRIARPELRASFIFVGRAARRELRRIAERPQCAERVAAQLDLRAVAAKEVFITGAGTLVLPVVSVDGRKVGDGAPGPVATKLRRLYIERAKESAI